MHPTCRLSFVILFGLILPVPARSETLSERIDQAVRQALPTYSQESSALSDDAEFLRRIYLDLAGIIPTSAEARKFFADKTSDKRTKLIEKLLGAEEFSRNLTYVFDNLFMDRRTSKLITRADWITYLQKSFKENKPYDQLVSEILTNDGSDPETRGRARFYLDRNAEPHQITKDICRVFLGMNLGCCQCHDHPVVDAYKQDHYFGIYAFLNRSYLFTDRKAKLAFFAEKADGEASFESVFKPKIVKKTGPRMVGAKEVPEPPLVKGKEYVKVVKAGERGIPTFSRREQLPKELTTSRQFARATVNRLWSQYLGRGIVHPLDYDHVGNPPSHPELIDLLTEEFIESHYDLKTIIRGIVLSETYQRSSEIRNDGKAPDAKWFAAANLRALTPEQLGWSMVQATGQLQADREANPKAKDTSAKYNPMIANFQTAFHSPEGEPSNPDFEPTLDQTLFLNNSGVVQNWLTRRNGCLTDRLLPMKDDGKVLAEELYLSVLTRRPSAEEAQEIADLMKASQDPLRTIQNLAWSLLTSAEFRFNH